MVIRHRFAAWTAARAAQRKWAGAASGLLVRGIEAAGFPHDLEASVPAIKSAEQFDEFHRDAGRRLIAFLAGVGVTATYGRAAKLLAVYLKSAVVLGPNVEMPVVALIHPPIDRIVLNNIATDRDLPVGLRRLCKATVWTQLDEHGYFDLIRAFRDHRLDQPAFWTLERRWNVSPERDDVAD